MDTARLKKLIQNADVVSFDVFDTLVMRIVNTPETIFEVTGAVCGLKDFAEKRQKLQQQASIKAEQELHIPHADMVQIYEYIAGHMDGDTDWAKVRDLEMQIEYDALVANPEIYEIYLYAISEGKKVIAVSDMYLDGAFLEKVLVHCGYKMDGIYDSADVHHTKFRGDMFDYVLQMEQIESGRLLHIGDNYESDVKNAQKAGIAAYHYAQESKPLDLYSLASKIEAGILRCVQKNKPDFWQRLGAQVGGPLYTGLFLWLTDRLKTENYDKIYFLSRDGYNLYHLFAKYTKEPAEYLYTSRRALLLAGIRQLDEESLAVLPPFTFGQTVREVLEYLDILDICEGSIRQAGFENLSSRIETTDDIKKVKQMYLFNETKFLHKCGQEREEAEKYFRSVGFFDNDSIVFDCGWNGSSQFLLDRFLQAADYRRHCKFYYTGILNTDKSRRQLKHKMFETYLFRYDTNYFIQDKVKDSIVLPELFFGAPDRSVLVYKEGHPVFEHTSEDLAYRAGIYEGIEDYIGCGFAFIEKYQIPVSPENAVLTMIRLIHDPSEEEAVKIGNLSNVDGFAKQEGEEKYIAYITEDAYKRNPKIEIYWMQGMMKRPDIDPQLKQRICMDRNLNRYQYLPAEQKLNRWSTKAAGYDQTAVKLLKKKFQKSFLPDVNQNQCRAKMADMDYMPLITFVVPVYNVLEEQLTACIESIMQQTYERWELWLVDDHSSWGQVRNVLHRYEKELKIHIIYRPENGNISKATNDGIAKANGEFLAFMDCDDTIERTALQEMVLLLNKNKNYDLIYSDEDKLTEDGSRRHSPFYKPDWSPDTFLSLMYTNHLAIYRTELVRKAGGLRTEYDGAQDYDFTLRFMEVSDHKRVGHVAKILYHWRERRGSIASGIEAKPYALDAMKRLKEEALKRRQIKGRAEFVHDLYQYRVIYEPEGTPLVSVVIPSKDHLDILRQCIDSIQKYTGYPNYEIIVVDNGSRETARSEIQQYLDEKHAVYIYEPMAFNFSRMCNIGADAANGEYLLLLNDDIEIFQHDWMDILLGQAMLDYAGAVGAKLLYPQSDTIQHIGITNLTIGPSHSLIGYPDSQVYYFGRNRAVYNWLAVSAACLMVKKSKYLQAKGLDEQLAVAYNDVDFCFKLYELGYYNSVRSDVHLYHHESLSRGSDDTDTEKQKRLLKERKYLYQKHPDLEGKDPFYNINLATDRVDYSINRLLKKYAQGRQLKRCPRGFPGRQLQVCMDRIEEDDEQLFLSGWCSTGDPLIDYRSKRYLLLWSEIGKIYRFEMEKIFLADEAEPSNHKWFPAGYQVSVNRNTYMMDIFTYRLGIMQESGRKTHICWLKQRTQKRPCMECKIRLLKQNEKDAWEKKEMLFHIDEHRSDEKGLYIRGWAVVEDADNLDFATQLYIKAGEEAYLCDVHALWRTDVALHFKEMSNIYMCGFESKGLAVKKISELWLLKRNLRTDKVIYTDIGDYI